MRRKVISSISTGFPELSQSQGQVAHVLLTRSPLINPRRGLTVRLACVKHAASVRPEPGSNSPSMIHDQQQNNCKVTPSTPKHPAAQNPHPTHRQKPHTTGPTIWHRLWHAVEFSRNTRTPAQHVSVPVGGNPSTLALRPHPVKSQFRRSS